MHNQCTKLRNCMRHSKEWKKSDRSWRTRETQMAQKTRASSSKRGYALRYLHPAGILFVWSHGRVRLNLNLHFDAGVFVVLRARPVR
jgi:hypothetical protein